jgi:hypothetical protein
MKLAKLPLFCTAPRLLTRLKTSAEKNGGLDHSLLVLAVTLLPIAIIARGGASYAADTLSGQALARSELLKCCKRLRLRIGSRQRERKFDCNVC